MAKFRVLKTDRDKTITKVVKAKDADGNKVNVIEYEDVTIKVGAYGHENIRTGQIIDVPSPHLAAKARANSAYFEEVSDEESPAEQSAAEDEEDAPRKRGRPRIHNDAA